MFAYSSFRTIFFSLRKAFVTNNLNHVNANQYCRIMLQSISFRERKLVEEDIIDLERKLGHKIPADYKQFLLDYNGGAPKPDCHDVQGTEHTMIGDFIGIRSFYSIGGPENESEYIKSCEETGGLVKYTKEGWIKVKECYSIESNCSVYHRRMPENFLPIGCDEGDNQVCISLYGKDEGTIWYWDHEGEIIPSGWNYFLKSHTPDYSNCYKVADNFQALLDGLYEYDYENDVRIP